MNYGMHCLGCALAHGETIAEAADVHGADLEKMLEEGAIYGEHYAEHFIPTIEVLKVIIERLEELQNGD